MKVHSNFAGQTSKHRSWCVPCATALAVLPLLLKSRPCRGSNS